MKRSGCIFIIVLILLSIIGYKIYYHNYFRVLYIQPLDKGQCITIFNGLDKRYIVPGKHAFLPKGNYLKLDISKTTSLSDAIYICWNEGMQWDMIIPNSLIEVNKLDTSQYLFSNKLPIDENNIPTVKRFSNEKCGAYDYESKGKSRKTDDIYWEKGKSTWVWTWNE